MNTQRVFGVAASLLGLTAVLLGAFGAHALRGKVSDAALAIFQTGVQYQFYHALALLGVALAPAPLARIPLLVSGWSLLAGSVIFSASLYLVALAGIPAFGAVAPLGGLLLIVGWASLSVAFWRASAR